MGYGPWPDAGEMAQWIGSTVQSQDPMWWTVDAGSGPVGMAVLLNRDPLDRRIEIGHIGYAPSVQRTTVNTERRVEWKLRRAQRAVTRSPRSAWASPSRGCSATT
jgi:hypothetical protein